MSEKYSSKSDAIAYGIAPALGEYAGDFDVDEIFERYYAWDGYAFVPKWTLDHPDWDDDIVGSDLFWEVVRCCEKEGE